MRSEAREADRGRRGPLVLPLLLVDMVLFGSAFVRLGGKSRWLVAVVVWWSVIGNGLFVTFEANFGVVYSLFVLGIDW